MANLTGRGTFKPGNPGGPGRLPRSVERSYLNVTLGAVPLAAWRRIVVKARKQAEDGDHRAREWLGKLLIGDDPIEVQALVEELRTELRRIKELPHVHNGQGNGAAPAH
jgi:hypothetical protein